MFTHLASCFSWIFLKFSFTYIFFFISFNIRLNCAKIHNFHRRLTILFLCLVILNYFFCALFSYIFTSGAYFYMHYPEVKHVWMVWNKNKQIKLWFTEKRGNWIAEKNTKNVALKRMSVVLPVTFELWFNSFFFLLAIHVYKHIVTRVMAFRAFRVTSWKRIFSVDMMTHRLFLLFWCHLKFFILSANQTQKKINVKCKICNKTNVNLHEYDIEKEETHFCDEYFYFIFCGTVDDCGSTHIRVLFMVIIYFWQKKTKIMICNEIQKFVTPSLTEMREIECLFVVCW